MSQSPIKDFSPAAVLRYRQGWKALNKLLHEDRSFSGHERNCAFLNLGDGRFADISAAIGFDFADDGRAVACVDWDRDGDLDLWVTNRTAPRLRFLRNDNPRGNHFLSVKLRGNGRTTNVDAIGARVELHLGGAEPLKLIKTLHAGDGFLAQSSKWLHFGLADRTEIDRLVVRWPGGKSETFRNFSVDHRYIVHQHGAAVAWELPVAAVALKASPPQLPKSSDHARIVLPAPLPAPAAQYVDRNGNKQSLLPAGHGPLLVNLWASWCRPCVAELQEWADHEAEIRDAGITILALSVDDLDDKSGDRGAAEAILKRAKFPFQTGWASAPLLQRLNTFQEAMLDRWQPLPIPSSFLIDRQGRVVVIYKGTLGVKQLLDDASLLTATPQQRRMAGLPFDGRWSTGPPTASPLRVSSQFIDRADISSAIDYLRRYGESVDTKHLDGVALRQLGDVYYVLASLLGDQGQAAEALAAYALAASYSSDDFRIRSGWGELLAQQRKFVEAAEQFRQALRITPGDVTTLRRLAGVHVAARNFKEAARLLTAIARRQPNSAGIRFQLGEVYRVDGDIRRAVEQYRAAVKLNPKLYVAANNLAWILATHPNSQIRNGEESVRWAKIVCEASGYKQPQLLDTLAAAYAEAGQFSEAAKMLERAIALPAAKQDTALGEKLRGRLELYRQEKPFRNSPPKP